MPALHGCVSVCDDEITLSNRLTLNDERSVFSSQGRPWPLPLISHIIAVEQGSKHKQRAKLLLLVVLDRARHGSDGGCGQHTSRRSKSGGNRPERARETRVSVL